MIDTKLSFLFCWSSVCRTDGSQSERTNWQWKPIIVGCQGKQDRRPTEGNQQFCVYHFSLFLTLILLQLTFQTDFLPSITMHKAIALLAIFLVVALLANGATIPWVVTYNVLSYRESLNGGAQVVRNRVKKFCFVYLLQARDPSLSLTSSSILESMMSIL